MICAGGNRKGACFVSIFNYNRHVFSYYSQGDSGGPLTQNGVLVGVVSSGDATASNCNANVSTAGKLMYIDALQA